MTLGQKLRKLRIDKNLTQKELADHLHVTFQTVSKWESDINEPDITTLKELSKLYETSFDYLLNDNETVPAETENLPVDTTSGGENKTIIIHQGDLHVCAKCHKDIPEEELVGEDINKKERHGRHVRSVSVGQTFYHRECYEQVKKERAAAKARARAIELDESVKKVYGWSGASGALVLVITLLVLLLVPECKETFHPGVAVAISFGAGYAIFSMLYCILSGSYIGDVFVWCATRSIRFPGLIFSWSLGGFAWLIAMKILFAIIGFLAGLFFLIFALAFSSLLGMLSFPFVLIHNHRTDYEDSLV